MENGLLSGALAGAAGATALNAVTYADMAVRGRSGSGLPEQTVDTIADKAGVSLGDEEETASNRRQSLGALLGIGVGIGVGAAYGLVRSRFRVPRMPAAVALGIAASVASEGPPTALGLTDPRTWGASGWVSDLAPHLAYGAVTAVLCDRLVSSPQPSRLARLARLADVARLARQAGVARLERVARLASVGRPARLKTLAGIA